MFKALRVAGILVMVVLTAWAAAALWIDGPANRPLAAGLAMLVLVAALLTGWFAGRGKRALALLPFVAVLLWWLSLPASNERDWLPDVARLPRVSRDGERLTFTNVRNFDYHTRDTDFTPHWETRSYDLTKLKGMDLFMSFWGPTLYAHTIMSWQFEDGPPLAISIETRKQRGEEYSALLGFFRQYELYYVVADERDVVGVRTRLRDEHMRLFRLKASPAAARALLLQYVDSINALAATPAWYNAFSTNCTTVILTNIRHLAPEQSWFDWRILANGYLDERLYEHGEIATGMPLPALRIASDVTMKARAAGTRSDFSERIRLGLPARPE